MSEKVLLVIVDFKKRDAWTIDDLSDEMTELVMACGAEVVDTIVAPINVPTAAYLIGTGKVTEIANAVSIQKVNTVIFSYDLKGSQQRNLEEAIKVKTIDRTQLILDIFARRATSQEGKMQVELAQLEYLLPRLVGKGVELSRLGGGIGTLGPGETKLEMDRRRIKEKITRLRKDLKEVAFNRGLKRKKRIDQGLPLISLVGYTNAGKSTLLNTLTDAEQITRDGLFTTLDSVSRHLTLANHQKVVITDTVGFMHELPHKLIEAFKATLEEVKEADLLLHVLDISQPNFRNLYSSVIKVLEELEAANKPTILVLNKIDKIEDRKIVMDIQKNYDNAITISAKTKENIPQFLEKINQTLFSQIVELDVTIPINRMDLVSLAHKVGEVKWVKYYEDTIHINAIIPQKFIKQFQI